LMYTIGRGVKVDPVQAARWHLIAQAGGNSDLALEDYVRKMKPEDRAAAEAAAKPWIDAINAQRSPEAQASQIGLNPP
jgi:TPR repeat protein